MFQVHFNLNVGGGDGREFAKLGDGKLLELLLKWGPVIALLFGIKLPPLPVSETVVEDVGKSG